jgi:MtrB/PioB family decaheme-associated outer membrane protein
MRNIALSLPVLFPVLLLALQSPVANAEETQSSGPTAKPECKQCMKYTGWRGELDFGLSYVSDDSLRFGDYRGLEEQGFYAALDGDIHFRNPQGRYFDLYARNLGYDSRQLQMRGGIQGRYELRFAWKEIPKYRGFGTQTPFLGQGSDHLALPANWVPSATTGGMTTLDSSLRAALLKTQRETLDAGATIHFARNWSYRVDFQRQNKKGTRSLGAGLFFNNSTILPAPVDFTTNQFDMGLTWATRRAQVQLAFIGSYFDNGSNSLTWQNPFTASPVHQTFRAALEPDNEYYQFNLSGAFAITPRIRLSGQAAIGRLSQDELFLPVTINPLYSDLPLPRQSLDGKLDTSTFNLSGKFSARLNSKLSFTARGKLDERDNKTPVDLYAQVTTDLLPSLARYNRPYSYEREQYSADLRYKAHRILKLSGGARQVNIDRTLQATERTEETTFWGELRLNPLVSSQIRIKLESSDRDISDYLQPDDGGPIDHPLMRKFNQADRDLDRVIVELDITPIAELGINFSFYMADADYKESQIGLQASEEQSFSVNLNYAVNKSIVLYAFVNLDDIDADIVNTTGGSATPWIAVTRDRIRTTGFGMSSRISEKSSIGLDFVSSDSEGDISVQTSAQEEPFDPLKTDLINAKIHYDHEVNDHWGYKLYAEYEKYSSRNWAIDGLDVDGISSILTMGEQSPEYKAWYLRVQASYRF